MPEGVKLLSQIRKVHGIENMGDIVGASAAKVDLNKEARDSRLTVYLMNGEMFNGLQLTL